jgi:hypothetical protein
MESFSGNKSRSFYLVRLQNIYPLLISSYMILTDISSQNSKTARFPKNSPGALRYGLKVMQADSGRMVNPIV